MTSTSRHLVQRADHHGAAPDDGRALVHHEAHGHGLEAVAFQGDELLAFGLRGLFGDAEQARLRRTVDVGIQDAGLEADGLEAECQVDGDGRFADAALAGGDGNDLAHGGFFTQRRGAFFRTDGGIVRGRALRRQDGADLAYAAQFCDSLFRRQPQRFHGCPLIRIDNQKESDVAFGNMQPGNHAKRNNVLPAHGVFHPAQGLKDIDLGYGKEHAL